jgi:hypothetical protein
VEIDLDGRELNWSAVKTVLSRKKRKERYLKTKHCCSCKFPIAFGNSEKLTQQTFKMPLFGRTKRRNLTETDVLVKNGKLLLLETIYDASATIIEESTLQAYHR